MKEKRQELVGGPSHVELLHGVNLVLHVVPRDQSRLEEIYNSLTKPAIFPSLGRHEDLLMIDSIKIVDIEDKVLKDNYTLKHDAYVPLSYYQRIVKKYTRNVIK